MVTGERLKRIISASVSAKELTRQILMFSRQTEQKLENVQLHAILEETLRLIRASTPATIRIENKTSAPTGAILADPSQIHQIIMNLCANAVHAMGGEVGVLTAKLEPVDLVISDQTMTGMKDTGMHAKIRSVRPRIPFILSTGFSETVTRELALAMGIRELIMKPYLKEELATVVRDALDHPVENTDNVNAGGGFRA